MRNWRSVRIFTSDGAPSQRWYFEMLERIVRPWLQANPGVDYFFTNYSVMVPGDPPAPNLEALPPGFLIQLPGGVGQMHRSIRIRFVEPVPIAAAEAQAPNGSQPAATPVETSLRTIIALDTARYWREAFDPYNIANGLGDERFSAFGPQQMNEREQRGENIARILKLNCDLVMASFQYNQDNITIETSDHEDNEMLGTPFQSVGHMLANIWWNEAKMPADIYVIDPATGQGSKI